MARIHTLCPRIESPCTQLPKFAPGQKSAFCDLCSKHVHNLSALTAGERRSLLEREAHPCVRYARWLPVAALVAVGSMNAAAQESAGTDAQENSDNVAMEMVEVTGGGIRGVADLVFLESEVEGDESWLDDVSAEAP